MMSVSTIRMKMLSVQFGCHTGYLHNLGEKICGKLMLVYCRVSMKKEGSIYSTSTNLPSTSLVPQLGLATSSFAQ